MSTSRNERSGSNGVGFAGLLTIVFIVLKLCGVIDWSWVWVLAPIWISLCLGLLFIIGFVAVGASTKLFGGKK